MSSEVVIYRNRTNLLPVSLGTDVSGETFFSEVREKVDPTSTLLATWTVTFDTDGTDGELVLRIDNSGLTNVAKNYGWMDIKRVSGGEPMPVLFEPVRVKFQEVVTA